MKRHLTARLGIKYAIDDDAVNVKMKVEHSPEVVEDDCPRQDCALAPELASREVGSMAPNAKLEANARRAAIARRERTRACGMQRAFEGHLEQTWRENTGETTTLAVTIRIG